MKKKYVSSILLILPLLLLPLEWYSKMKVDPSSFKSLGTNGVDVLLDSHLRIGLIFLLVIIIQVLSVKCNTIIYSVLTKILLCIVLGLYPVAYYGSFGLIKKFIFEFYSIGFYLSLLLIIISIIADVIVNRQIKIDSVK